MAFFLAGALARLWVLRSPLGDADSDEAVTGLMAMHFLDGEIDALYWGATYAGTLEPMLTATVFSVVGPSVIALKAVPIAFTVLAAFLVWRAAREYFGAGYGPLEGAVFWVFPAANLLLLMKAQVVYASGTCFMVAILILSLRMRREARPVHFLLFGVLTGLSLWATPLTMATIVPVGIATLARTWRKHVMNLWFIPGVIVGALPWLVYSIRNDWVTLRQVGTLTTSYAERVKGCFTELYPLLLGLRKPITLEWLVSPGVGATLFVALFVALIAVPLHRYRTVVLPLVLTVLLFPFLYAVSTTSWYTAEPRHGMFVAPVLIMLAVSLVPRIVWAQIGAFILAFGLTVSTLGHVEDLGLRHPRMATVRPGKLAPVLGFMRERGLDACYADYWIAYRVTFESEEDIICAAYWGDRYPPYRQYADGHGARTYLFIAGTDASNAFRARLQDLRLGYLERRFDTVDLFLLDQASLPEHIGSCVIIDWVEEPRCPN